MAWLTRGWIAAMILAAGVTTFGLVSGAHAARQGPQVVQSATLDTGEHVEFRAQVWRVTISTAAPASTRARQA